MHSPHAITSCALCMSEHVRHLQRLSERLLSIARDVPTRFVMRRALRRAERHLLRLDDYILKDLGIERRELEATFGDAARQRRTGAALLGPVYGSVDPFR